MRNFHSIRPLRLLLNSQNNLSYSDSILMKSCIFNLGFKSPSNSIFLHHFEGVNPLYFENYCYWWEGYGNLKCILISHLYFLSDNFYQFSSVQSLSHVSHFPTPWTAAHQASRSITNSQSLLKLMSIEWVVSANHSSSVAPFSSCLQSFPASGSLPMSKFFPFGGKKNGVSASATVLPMNIKDSFPLGLTGLISLQSMELSIIFFNTTVQNINSSALRFLYSPTLTSIHD